MTWIARKFESIVLKRVVFKVADFLDGKKTTIGALSLVLWVVIYAIPAFTPEYNFLTVYAVFIRDSLQANGIQLDNDLFNTGVGFTVVGLLDKVRKLYKEYKDERKQKSR